MKIQDKYKRIDEIITNLSNSDYVSDLEYKKYWQDLTKWLNKKEFFGKWGYDFENHVFLKEPEDPAQQKFEFIGE
jgi:hypothetical protein